MSVLGIAGLALGQYSTDFEGDAASTAGITVNGTPSPTPGPTGWYQPVATLSKDFLAYTYAGNGLGIPANPNGGANFLGGRNTGVSDNTRTQRAFGWTGTDTYTVSWDICWNFGGTLPAVDNVGSFSLQPSTTARFWQTLYRYVTPASADFIKAEVNCFSSTGVATNNLIAGPEWTNLALNNWYRQSYTFDMATNQILECSIQDITGGGSVVTVQPVGWFLAGGAAPTQALPTDLRWFAGGTTAGNTMAVDNFEVVIEAQPCYADCDGSGSLNIFDYICFGNAYTSQQAYADCDGNNQWNIFDYICYGNAYSAGCP